MVCGCDLDAQESGWFLAEEGEPPTKPLDQLTSDTVRPCGGGGGGVMW